MANSEPLVFPRRAAQLRTRLESAIDLKKLYAEIDRIPDLKGAAVVYIDPSMNAVQLRRFEPLCSRHPIRVILREAPPAVSPENFRRQVEGDSKDGRAVGYAVGTAASCGAAVLGWAVFMGGAAGSVASFGTSSAISVLSFSAASASSAQCVIGAARTYNELFKPETNDYYDSIEWFTTMESALDVISLAGATAAGVTTLKLWNMLKSASSRSTRDILRGLTRHERHRLTMELYKANHPALNKRAIKLLIKQGDLPRRLPSRQLSGLTMRQLKDAVGASLSFGGSALSGTLNTLAIGVYREASE